MPLETIKNGQVNMEAQGGFDVDPEYIVLDNETFDDQGDDAMAVDGGNIAAEERPPEELPAAEQTPRVELPVAGGAVALDLRCDPEFLDVLLALTNGYVLYVPTETRPAIPRAACDGETSKCFSYSQHTRVLSEVHFRSGVEAANRVVGCPARRGKTQTGVGLKNVRGVHQDGMGGYKPVLAEEEVQQTVRVVQGQVVEGVPRSFHGRNVLLLGGISPLELGRSVGANRPFEVRLPYLEGYAIVVHPFLLRKPRHKSGFDFCGHRINVFHKGVNYSNHICVNLITDHPIGTAEDVATAFNAMRRKSVALDIEHVAISAKSLLVPQKFDDIPHDMLMLALQEYERRLRVARA